MKTTKLIFAFIIGLFVTASAFAQSNENQLYFVYKQIVKSDKIDRYVELSKTWASACKEQNSDFSFSVWQSNIYDFYWFYPVDDYNSAEKVNMENWNIVSNLEKDFASKFSENIEYTEDFFIRSVDSLSYIPKTNVEGLVYAEWWISYNKPWTGMKFRKAFKQAAEMQKNVNFEYPISVAHSDIGMNGGSSFILEFWGKDVADLYNHQAKSWENLGEEIQQIIKDLEPVRRKFEKIPFWYQEEMSYTPE